MSCGGASGRADASLETAGDASKVTCVTPASATNVVLRRGGLLVSTHFPTAIVAPVDRDEREDCENSSESGDPRLRDLQHLGRFRGRGTRVAIDREALLFARGGV